MSVNNSSSRRWPVAVTECILFVLLADDVNVDIPALHLIADRLGALLKEHDRRPSQLKFAVDPETRDSYIRRRVYRGMRQ
jgi:hypothetical protein